MKRLPFILYSFLLLGIIMHMKAEAGYDPVVKDMQPGTITIIGESHQQNKSIWLFKQLVVEYLQKNQCLIVGLEIASNQQLVVDRVMQGRAKSSAINLSSIIDHLPFRKMIDYLAELKQKGACITLVAIDAGDDIDMGRDQWMTLVLAEQVSEAPVLVLLGNLHTLKKVVWDLSMTDPSPFVSEILIALGFNVRTFPQIWTSDACSPYKVLKYRFITPNRPEALEYLNHHIISLLNAHKYKSAAGVIDGIVVWECGLLGQITTLSSD